MALARLGWNNATLANTLGCNEKLVRKWLAGEIKPPLEILLWLQSLIAFVEAHPAPDWRQRKRKDHDGRVAAAAG